MTSKVLRTIGALVLVLIVVSHTDRYGQKAGVVLVMAMVSAAAFGIGYGIEKRNG